MWVGRGPAELKTIVLYLENDSPVIPAETDRYLRCLAMFHGVIDRFLGYAVEVDSRRTVVDEDRSGAGKAADDAEDPFNNFRPNPGKITALHLPGGRGIRVDTHVYAGYRIPHYYDSMIAKLIAVGRTREEAIEKMIRALDEIVIEGVQTTVAFHQQLLRNDKFREGDYTTKFMDSFELKS